MKKLFFYAAVAAAILTATACSSDEDEEEVITTGSFIYVEPLCSWGSSMDDIQTDMAAVTQYKLTTEGASSLTYSGATGNAVLTYNFAVTGLISAQITVDKAYESQVVKSLQSRYNQMETGDEAEGDFFFYPADKSTSITTGIAGDIFFVTYVRVTK